MALEHRMTVTAAVDNVAEVLCSEQYNIAMQRSREDVVDVEYVATGDDESKLSFELRFLLYSRTKTGGIDRSKKVNSRTVYRYQKASRTLHWHHVAEEEERVKVSGQTRLISMGEQTRIERDVDIDVRIPIIGKGIKKIIEREFRKGFGRVESQIKEILDKA